MPNLKASKRSTPTDRDVPFVENTNTPAICDVEVHHFTHEVALAPFGGGGLLSGFNPDNFSTKECASPRALALNTALGECPEEENRQLGALPDGRWALVREEEGGGLSCSIEKPLFHATHAIDALAAISPPHTGSDLQTWWEEKEGRPAEHASATRATDSGSLLCGEGDEIKCGEQIRLHFWGGPTGMPEPWTLVKAENYFSSVNYRLNPRVTVRAANGVEGTFDNANFYSPCRPT